MFIKLKKNFFLELFIFFVQFYIFNIDIDICYTK